jgi:glycine cleavage system aminomethyltransferase T
MTALAFLTPDATEVAARSPMHRQAAAAGARFEARDGWEVAVAYGNQGDYSRSVSFADRSQLVKVELTGTPPIQLEPGVATKRDGTWWCPVTPTRTLVLGGPAARRTDMSFVDLTSGLAAVELIGPGANELLARFCAIDVRPQSMPVAAFRPGSVARTPGYVLRTAEDRLLIMVGCALGAYLWDVVADAAEHLGGGPVA